MGITTINVIRHSHSKTTLPQRLLELGASHVIFDTEIQSEANLALYKRIGNPSVAFDCITGEPGEMLIKVLGKHARYLNYGAMSLEPVRMSISDFVFRDLTACGFWVSQW